MQVHCHSSCPLSGQQLVLCNRAFRVVFSAAPPSSGVKNVCVILLSKLRFCKNKSYVNLYFFQTLITEEPSRTLHREIYSLKLQNYFGTPEGTLELFVKFQYSTKFESSVKSGAKSRWVPGARWVRSLEYGCS